MLNKRIIEEAEKKDSKIAAREIMEV